MRIASFSALGVAAAIGAAACSGQGTSAVPNDASADVDAAQAPDANTADGAVIGDADASDGAVAIGEADASDGGGAIDDAAPVDAPTLSHLGVACANQSDCASGVCAHSVCTRACGSQSDCPVGFDCGIAVPGDATATCYAVQYDTTSPGGFGTSCASVSTDPTGTAPCDPSATSPCASGFVCLASAMCDPAAVCTKACAADTDCPPSMFCGTRDDKSQLCMPRVMCSTCALDDECPAGAVCALGADGERACQRTCASQSDCPHPEADADGGALTADPFTCEAPGDGGATKVCAPASGTCHGPSAIAAIQGDGQVCSGCRVGVPSDCAAGLICYRDAFSLESFCTESCTVQLLGSTVTEDTCPAGSFCTIGDPANYGCTASSCMASGACTADPQRLTATCHPL
jgi:hypothetical protein